MPRTLSAAQVRRLRRHLRCGGVVAYPTESSYGLGCLPQHPQALRRLIRLKKRPQHKGLIVIGHSLPALQPLLGKLPEAQRQLAEQSWPAPLTLLLPAHPTLPAALRGRRRHKLAVRVPAHRAARELCRLMGTPLVSTSCNRAGQRPCRNEREARRQFGRQAAVIGGRTGGAKTPSRIIDAENGRRLR